jgi:hypothetical protein
VSQNVLMGKKKPKDANGGPGNPQVRIQKPLLKQAEILAKRRAQTPTQVINNALREALEKEGLWPLPDSDAAAE